MTELLERWRSRQPVLCGLTHPDHSQLWVRHSGQRWYFFEHDRASYAHVLAAVIEAIEARGWGWDLSSSIWRPAIPGSMEARRTYNAFLNLRPGIDLETLREEYDQSSPAAALLSVYVAALEAEAGQ